MEVPPPFQLAGWIIQWNVHLKSLAQRVAARLTMADMEKGNYSSGKPRNVPTFESIILDRQKQVARSITLDTKWWVPGAKQLAEMQREGPR
jgi:hypothetical protein